MKLFLVGLYLFFSTGVLASTNVPTLGGGDPCLVPLIRTTKTYHCSVPGANVAVSVRETNDENGWWQKGGVISYRITESGTGRTLDAGQEQIDRTCKTNDYESGGKLLRQYYFGSGKGNGSLRAYVISDNDRGYRRIWINSVRVPSADGYFRCN